MTEDAVARSTENARTGRRPIIGLMVVAGVLCCIGVGWLFSAPPHGVTYSMDWDVSGVEVASDSWLLREGPSAVRVDTFELVTYSVELMPCASEAEASGGLLNRALATVSRIVVPHAHAGHSGERNDIATPYSVIERPTARRFSTLTPAASSRADWCRVHWLVARSDDDTLLQGDEVLPQRRSLLVAGARRTGEDAPWVPFEVSTPLGNGRYFDLSEPKLDTDTGHVRVTRSAGALLGALMTERPARETEREVLRVLFESASVGIERRRR